MAAAPCNAEKTPSFKIFNRLKTFLFIIEEFKIYFYI